MKDETIIKLYHSSKLIIQNPDIYYGRKNADFGQGFYLSPDKDFVVRWATANSYINVYELDTDGLDIHKFIRSKEWFEYIFENRRTHDSINADVIVGPIANDIIFDTMGIISSGFLTAEQSLELLMIGPQYTQIAIKSEKAVAQLKWILAEQITDIADIKSQLKLEEEVYQNEFAKIMNSFE